MDKKEIKYLDKELTLNFMSVPTMSSHEEMVQNFIKDFALSNKIDCCEDDKGNLYLTKGKNEIYPCVTSHMDSVQNHTQYIKKKENLPLKTCDVYFTDKDLPNKERELCTKLYMDNMGLGCDDKCGIAICLSLFLRIDNLKGAFFVEEEIGCKGSNMLDIEFFENVGYVIGFDSPEVNRAAHSCSGVQLFTKDFHKDHIKEICERWGVTKFYSEPFTDIKCIRQLIPVQCMNFGAGYYSMHSPTEYCLLEHMDNACGMGVDIITSLGNVKYEYPCDDNLIPWILKKENTEEINYLKELGDNDYKKYLTNFSGNNYSHLNQYSSLLNGYEDDYYDDDSQTPDDYIDYNTLAEMMSRYEDREEDIKDNIHAKCLALGIDYESEFAEFFNIPFPFDVDELPF